MWDGPLFNKLVQDNGDPSRRRHHPLPSPTTNAHSTSPRATTKKTEEQLNFARCRLQIALLKSQQADQPESAFYTPQLA